MFDELVKTLPNGQWVLIKKIREPSIGTPSAMDNPPTVEGGAKTKRYQGGDPRHEDRNMDPKYGAKSKKMKTRGGLEYGHTKSTGDYDQTQHGKDREIAHYPSKHDFKGQKSVPLAEIKWYQKKGYQGGEGKRKKGEPRRKAYSHTSGTSSLRPEKHSEYKRDKTVTMRGKPAKWHR